MRRIECDVAIIGAGTAGLAARAAAHGAGARTLLIEAGPGGTTCARTGCMPSKLLIAAAAAAHGAAGLDAFGLRLDGRVVVYGPAVMRRLRAERDRFVAGVLDSMARIPEGERLDGRARFLADTALAVGDDLRVMARAVVVAAGSRPSVPEPLRGLGNRVLTNESVFELPDLPPSLAVLGAGPLGIELAQGFARLGVRVAVFEKGETVGGLADPEVAASARAILAHGLSIRFGTEIEAAPDGDGVVVSWSGATGAGRETFARLLVATGRPPALDGLGLDRTTLALDGYGMPKVDPATLRCGESAIFLAGDADGTRPVLHEAADEGRIAGANAARFPDVRPSARMVPLSVVYTDPEIATVGGGWKAHGGSRPAIGDVDFAESGRARVMAAAKGRLRVYARPEDGLLLGGEICAPGAEHLAHLLGWAVQLGLTAEAALALPFYHPTLEESLRGALRQICGAVRSRPHARPEDVEFGPGG